MKTTVICRLYKDEGSANGMRDRLYRAGFPAHVLSVVTPGSAEEKSGLAAKVEEARVPSDAAAAFAAKIKGGASLVVVRATYKPLNAVRIATEAFETSGANPPEDCEGRYAVKTPPDPSPSILKDHPRFLTLPPSGEQGRGLVSERIGWSLLSAPRRRDSVQRPAKRFFGEGISRRARGLSVMQPPRHVSKAFWPMPLLASAAQKSSILPGGGHPLSRLFGWPTKS